MGFDQIPVKKKNYYQLLVGEESCVAKFFKEN